MFALLERMLTNDLFKGKVRMNPSKDPPSIELNKVLNNGFQGLLKETHIWAMCALNHIIRWIHYWNSTSLRMLWMAPQGMSIS